MYGDSAEHTGITVFAVQYLTLSGHEGFAPLDSGFISSSEGTYIYRGGVQSPRDGILSLDVTTSISTSVAALGMGVYTSGPVINQTWWNGTLTATGTVHVGDFVVPLGSWTVDTYDMVEETYTQHGDMCYGRFVTMPDSSGYTVQTIAVPAEQGEHVPVELHLTVHGPTLDSATSICYATTFESVIVQFMLESFSVDVR